MYLYVNHWAESKSDGLDVFFFPFRVDDEPIAIDPPSRFIDSGCNGTSTYSLAKQSACLVKPLIGLWGDQRARRPRIALGAIATYATIFTSDAASQTPGYRWMCQSLHVFEVQFVALLGCHPSRDFLLQLMVTSSDPRSQAHCLFEVNDLLRWQGQ